MEERRSLSVADGMQHARGIYVSFDQKVTLKRIDANNQAVCNESNP